jgi:hypothetical protein
MTINIPTVDYSPSDADVHFLDDQINRYNVQATGITAAAGLDWAGSSVGKT